MFYLLGYDATLLGNWFPIFRDNILVLSSQVERSKKNAGDSWMVIKGRVDEVSLRVRLEKHNFFVGNK